MCVSYVCYDFHFVDTYTKEREIKNLKNYLKKPGI